MLAFKIKFLGDVTPQPPSYHQVDLYWDEFMSSRKPELSGAIEPVAEIPGAVVPEAGNTC